MKSYLLCVCPVGGHVAPILTVARHLVNAGHRVRMLTGSRFAPAVSATGAEFVALPEEADCDDRNLDESFPHHGRERRLSMGQASTDSAGCLVRSGLWSGDIELLSQLPNLEPCEPRGRNGDELAAMVSLLRVRWEGGVDVSKARNVWRLAF
jgi:hypothetical protein